jgi:hypothetical protein
VHIYIYLINELSSDEVYSIQECIKIHIEKNIFEVYTPYFGSYPIPVGDSTGWLGFLKWNLLTIAPIEFITLNEGKELNLLSRDHYNDYWNSFSYVEYLARNNEIFKDEPPANPISFHTFIYTLIHEKEENIKYD